MKQAFSMISVFILLVISFGQYAAAAGTEGPVSAAVPFDIVGGGSGLQAVAAGTSVFTQVLEVRVDDSGQGLVRFVDPLSGTSPACVSAGFHDSLAFDVTTPGGKGILALMITAKSTGQTVVAGGKGVCTIYSQVEDWRTGWLD